MSKAKERYIAELGISESDINNETNKEKLITWWNEIDKLLIPLRTNVKYSGAKVHQGNKNFNKEYMNTFYKTKVFSYFLNLISLRQSELKKLEKVKRTKQIDNENELIIKELRKHVSEEVFMSIVANVRNELKKV